MTSLSVGSRVSRRTRRGFTSVACMLAAVIVLGACAAEEPVEETPAAPKDLSLTIGALVPESGALEKFGPAVAAAIALAAQDVNDANAKLTVNVETQDSGDSTGTSAEDAATELLGAGATVIVGGLSNGVSKKVIDEITGAGVVLISPANDSPDFTNYDDKGLYWRTSPSCALEGTALGTELADNGEASIAILSEDVLCGAVLPRAVSESYLRGGGEIVSQATIDEDATGIDDKIEEAIAAAPDAAAILGSGQAEKIAKAFIAAGYSGDQLYFSGLSLGERGSGFDAGSLTGSIVTHPGLDISTISDFTDRLLEINPSLKDFSYAAESYDAVILASLAALVAQGVSGADISSAMQEVSGGSGDGEIATSFSDAAKIVLDGRTVDYEGVSGSITLSDNGDPLGAVIGIYRYGSDDVYTRIN